MELVFEIRDAEESGFFASALGHSIFTEADSWDELRASVLDAFSLHFDDGREPSAACLDELRQGRVDPLEAA